MLLKKLVLQASKFNSSLFSSLQGNPSFAAVFPGQVRDITYIKKFRALKK